MKKPTVKQMKKRPSLWWKKGQCIWIVYPCGKVIFYSAFCNEWIRSIWCNRLYKFKQGKQFIGWL